jgi:Carboxypeptidase regulatory-like domain
VQRVPNALVRHLSVILSLLTVGPVSMWAQSSNATISGIVTDQSGAAIPGAEVSLTTTVSGTVTKITTREDGLFAFPNLQQGSYEIKAAAATFRDYVQRGIEVHLNESVRVPITLQIGTAEQTIEVVENASAINYENPEVKGTITRTQIDSLPLQVAGSQRSAAVFVTLLPGVNPGGTGDAFTARFNGGQLWSDEAVMDGVSMVEGLLSQSGMVAIHNDFPISPEAVGEISVLTANFDTQFGASSAAVIIASTKEGTNGFHGGTYEYLRNEDLNARQWGGATRPKDRENDLGAYIGGPLKIPGFWSSRKKSFFFVNFEAYRSLGSTNAQFLTVPTAAMRTGDFSAWPYPIYDPSTSHMVNGQIVRTQFMGCNGNQPNVICATDPLLTSSLAQGWLKYVPLPNRPGLQANWEAPNGLASSLNADTDQWDVRGDQYIGEKDHVEITYHYRGSLPFTQHAFPAVIDTNNTRIPNYSHLPRLNYDHIFQPTLLNHFALGYLDLPTKVYNASDCCVSEVPEIQGVYSHAHEPALNFGNGYSSYGGNADFYTRRPSWVGNDILTWVKGRHSLHFGAEYRNIQYPTLQEPNGSGTFNFAPGETGILGQTSGNAMASFLLGEVDNASATFYTLPSFKPKSWSIGAFAGDTWKATSNLTVTLGLRWDRYAPSTEKNNETSFFDPYGPNPGADGRPGRLAFAGTGYGAASFGRDAPEYTWNKAFGPRGGLAYSFDKKNVARLGYGIFFEQNFYPGWNAGIGTDGFNTTASFSSSNGGLTPAFLLQDGFPQNFAKPPFISSSLLNGQDAPNYRPFDANRLPYAQQWNVSYEHQFSEDLYGALAYVGNKGTRLLSQINPLNALNPSLLSMGSKLYDVFTPGMASLDGVPAPYPGWAAQMTGCAPSVAQALLPYPQYCGNIYGQNENDGNSTYNSLQAKLEKRLSKGLWSMVAYTWSKTITDADSAQSSSTAGNYEISPFQMKRDKSLSNIDVPQVLAWSLTYNLPMGPGKRFLNTGGLVGRVIGGWQLTSIVRYDSGQPLIFTSSYCNVPSQFAAGCLPGILPGANIYAQSMSNYNPNKPLFNVSAFEPVSDFNFGLGDGPRVSNIRGFGYHNQDFGLEKETPLNERFRLLIRVEAFNMWNFHIFTAVNAGGFVNTDIASPSFGLWNGNVSAPRNIQLGGKLTF